VALVPVVPAALPVASEPVVPVALPVVLPVLGVCVALLPCAVLPDDCVGVLLELEAAPVVPAGGVLPEASGVPCEAVPR